MGWGGMGGRGMGRSGITLVLSNTPSTHWPNLMGILSSLA